GRNHCFLGGSREEVALSGEPIVLISSLGLPRWVGCTSATTSLIWQSMRRVCDGPSSSEGGGNHRSLGQLCFGCTCLARVTAMDIDAIGALSSDGNGDRNQLLILYWNCSLGDGGSVEGPKGFHHFRREGVHSLQLGQVFFFIHKYIFMIIL